MLKALTDDVTWIAETTDADDYLIHTSVYLVETDAGYLLIDTGSFSHQDPIKEQIDDATGGEGINGIFVFKGHTPHTANVREFKDQWPDAELIFPGAEPDVEGFPSPATGYSPPRGDVLILGREFALTDAPLLDIQHTVWLFDRESSIYFTADGFCSYAARGREDRISSEIGEGIQFDQIHDFYIDILPWTRYVDPQKITEALKGLLQTHEPTIIAPSHGSPIDEDDIPDYLSKFKESMEARNLQYSPPPYGDYGSNEGVVTE